MKTFAQHNHPKGSALVAAMIIVVLISILSANAFITLQNRYRTTNQTIAWQEALLATEGGIDLAMSQIRKAAVEGATGTWKGWKGANGEDFTQTEFEAGSNFPAWIISEVFNRTTEGSNTSSVRVEVHAPADLRNARGEQWYKIRATGMADIPGQALLAGDTMDTNLRKVFLRANPVSGPIDTPQAVRCVEAIAKPIGTFSKALVANGILNMNNHTILVDSYDSTDPNKSTNGQYPSEEEKDKRQENGDIATNGQVIDASHAEIHGDASTNGGDVLNGDNVTGEIDSDFYQELPYVYDPPWALGDEAAIMEDQRLSDGAPGIQPGAAEVEMVFEGTKMTSPFTIKAHVEGGEPVETTVKMLVRGDFEISGHGQITLEPGVTLELYIEGDGSIAGNGFVNEGTPLNLMIFGSMTPEETQAYEEYGTEPEPRDFSISGNGGFVGAAYLPMADITLSGGGNSDHLYGAFAGRTIELKGGVALHYDEALADGGLISDYRVTSWFEDFDSNPTAENEVRTW